MTRTLLYFGLICFVIACSPISKSALKKRIAKAETEFQDHIGFVVKNAATNEDVFIHNGDRYFTPASNTKIFTLFASLKILGDSVPAFQYYENADSVIIWGTGDPSFLYKNVFNNFRAYDFLKSFNKPIYFSNSNFQSPHLGPGWAWDDYNSDYSVERSPFPVYGNTFNVRIWGDTIFVVPPFLGKGISIGDSLDRRDVIREVYSNNFKIHPGRIPTSRKSWDIPLRIEQETISQLLADTLDKPVVSVSIRKRSTVKDFYSIPADSLYRELMQDSDNFIAEQLLLMCANELSDTLQTEIAIRYVTENFLNDLSDKPQWVDGSGLSRYNLFTPRSIVQLWKKLADIKPMHELLPLLATGGKNGTIRNWYKAPSPYVFGKTGTLRNNHSLSGFLICKSGKILVFSFMSNNYTRSINEVRTMMQEILYLLYDRY